MNVLELRRRTLGKGVYKKTVEGNPAIAQGSLARMYPGIIMQGWTEQDSTEGKNLFDGAQFGQSGKVLHVESTFGNRDITGIDYKQNTAYTISIESYEIVTPSPSGDWSVNFTIYYTDRSKDQKYTKYLGGNPLTSNKNKTIRRMTIENPWNVEEKITGIMINEGDEALPYEPYTGGQPSPSPEYPQPITSAGKYDEEAQKYEYQVKLTGNNLWNAEEATETSKWVASTSQTGYSDFAIDVIPGQKVTVSFPEKLSTGKGMYVGIVLTEDGNIDKWMHHSTQEGLIFQQQTVTAAGDKIWIRCSNGSVPWFSSDNPYFQVEYGEERTDFQPYKEQTVTLTADRPLTKWDRLEKRNGQWGWVYKSAEIVLDGSEDEAWSNYSNYNGFLCSGVLNAIYTRTAGICSQGVVDQSGSIGTPNTIWLGGNTATIYWINNNYYDSGLEDEGLQNLKDHLSQIPVVIWYETESETFVPLSESEQEAMNALHTFRPTTVLSNDCECEMTLTYKTKKSLEVTD